MRQTFLNIFGRTKAPGPLPPDHVMAGGERVPLVFVRNLRARRYLLRLRPDGAARVTIPRGGSAREAKDFAERHSGWIATQLKRLPLLHPSPQTWTLGSEILFRGERTRIEADPENPRQIRIGQETIRAAGLDGNLRPAIERHLHRLAARELPVRVREFAALHRVAIRRITVRNQRSRWGSCSHKGEISLNWRLLQAPNYVRDYIILHELMHVRQMNHSRQFWREVAAVCPDYRTAERWLKENRGLLRQ